MAKLRDWWPSEEAMSQKSLTPSPSPSPSSVSAQAAAPWAQIQSISSNTENVSTKSKALKPTPPAFKLTNKQRLKEELLQQLLNSSTASPAATPPTSAPSSSPPSGFPTAVNPLKHLQSQSTSHGGFNLNPSPSPNSPSPTPAATPRSSMSRREIHIYSERERRKGMTHLYSTLHSLLPSAKPKADRCSVLSEAMEYIEELRGRLDELSKQKKELIGGPGSNQPETNEAGDAMATELQGSEAEASMAITEEEKAELLNTADVAVRYCGRDAFVTLNGPKKRGLWPRLLQTLLDAQFDLLNVTLSSSLDADYHCVHARMESTTSKIRSQELQKLLQELIISHARQQE